MKCLSITRIFTQTTQAIPKLARDKNIYDRTKRQENRFDDNKSYTKPVLQTLLP